MSKNNKLFQSGLLYFRIDEDQLAVETHKTAVTVDLGERTLHAFPTECADEVAGWSLCQDANSKLCVEVGSSRQQFPITQARDVKLNYTNLIHPNYFDDGADDKLIAAHNSAATLEEISAALQDPQVVFFFKRELFEEIYIHSNQDDIGQETEMLIRHKIQFHVERDGARLLSFQA